MTSHMTISVCTIKVLAHPILAPAFEMTSKGLPGRARQGPSLALPGPGQAGPGRAREGQGQTGLDFNDLIKPRRHKPLNEECCCSASP